MFVKKDTRKIREILQDQDDRREDVFLARRAAEFPMGLIQSVLCREPQVEALRNMQHLSLYGNELIDLTGIGSLGACTQLVSIDLGKNKLTKIPEEFAKLQSLETFCCEDNQLSMFPLALLELQNLRTIRLSNNIIPEIPQGIERLEKLEKLLLDNNKISTIPSAIGQLRELTMLNLRGNQVKFVPSELVQLTKLTVLNLSSNQLESFLENQYPSDFSAWNGLKLLMLNGNKLEIIPDGLIHGLPSEQCRINIANNSISDVPATFLEKFPDANTFGQRQPQLSKAELVELDDPMEQEMPQQDE